ncbi:MAG TPA: MBL fold metallo-hydrolase [Actinomycetota bacterium]|jgi:L-ascorbate metabolism protein UlaG (beta-lactamase superfamily)|nr:MBL fold metallo-hydrolase [Actinomycetota bacterium]
MLEHVTWFRQAALRWRDEERTVYIDPWGTGDDPPPADVILISHAHLDHFRPDEIDKLRRPGTKLVAPHDVADELTGDVTAVRPGESLDVGGVHIETVPAYNTREEALEFHPRRNDWVGYVIELGGARYYHAGDTDHAPELDDVRADVAFLPIGGHFTMDWRAAADLARAIEPSLAVPIHYGFVICSPTDGVRFRDAAAPVAVELLAPVDDFEQE